MLSGIFGLFSRQDHKQIKELRDDLVRSVTDLKTRISDLQVSTAAHLAEVQALVLSEQPRRADLLALVCAVASAVPTASDPAAVVALAEKLLQAVDKDDLVR